MALKCDRMGRKPIKLIGKKAGIYSLGDQKSRKRNDKRMRIKSRPSSVKVRGEKISLKPNKKKREGTNSSNKRNKFGSLKRNLIVDDQSSRTHGYKEYRKRPASKKHRY